MERPCSTFRDVLNDENRGVLQLVLVLRGDLRDDHGVHDGRDLHDHGVLFHHAVLSHRGDHDVHLYGDLVLLPMSLVLLRLPLWLKLVQRLLLKLGLLQLLQLVAQSMLMNQPSMG